MPSTVWVKRHQKVECIFFSTELKNRSSLDKNVVINFIPMVPIYQFINRIIIFLPLDKTFMVKIMLVCQKEGSVLLPEDTLKHSRYLYSIIFTMFLNQIRFIFIECVIKSNITIQQEMSQTRDECPQRNWSSIRHI